MSKGKDLTNKVFGRLTVINDTGKRKHGCKVWLCKWSTRREQTLNTRRNVKITLNNETKTLTEWAEQYGFNVNTIQYRYYRGDRGERLFRPINHICNWRKKCIVKSV